ncbi:MAG: acyl--CoA ligase [Gaiellales bacterium]|nr:acyl--CoA ligase [Gaiellales bacterium]
MNAEGKNLCQANQSNSQPGADEEALRLWAPQGPWDGPAIPLRDVFGTWARRTPGKLALICGDRRLTYADMEGLVAQATAALQASGFKPGDRLAISAQNSVELVVFYYALTSAGCIAVWVNPSYRGQELLFPLANTGARALLVDDAGPVLDQVAEAKSSGGLPELECIYTRTEAEEESGAGSPLRVQTWESFIRAGDPTAARPVEAADDDYAMIIHTSGATGVPKGAPSTHWQCTNEGFHYARALRTGPEDVFLGALPMFHSFGFICLLNQPFQLGATLVVMPEWNTGEGLRLIEEEKITVHPMAPTHYLLEMKHADFGQRDLTSMRTGLISGYVPPRDLFDEIEQKYPGMVYSNFWGSSETGPGLFSPYDALREKRYFTVGRAVVGEEVRVADAESGEELPLGTPGELQVRGPNVIREYWNNPEETQRHFHAGGWFKTGDMATLDEDGYVTIVGRIKDQINRGGLKITPSDLEQEIQGFPGVEQVCVIGVPNPVLGESICVCVVPTAGCQLDLDQLRAFLATRVARNHLPDELCLMDEFPRLSGGVKIDKYGKQGLRALVLAREDRQVYRKKK